ncbi:anti-sigma factor [Pararhodobacter sp. SW119]|uniref:anti-sigma factor n=1 Tax=Pararhodobacter sp. SW119 TaxID=2780075 RepID=UPI001ADFB191|nr:anti-sigma factor [Pararhodobacter sp. SW119]
MSDPTHPDDFGPEERDELLAAEYVLGLLPAEEHRAAGDRVAVDGAFAERVRQWEARLSPLNAGFEEVPIPDLLPRIEARLFRQTEAFAPKRRFAFGWGAGTLAAAAMAAVVFLAVTLWPPGPAPVVLQADLAAEDAELRFAARWDGAAGQLELTRTAGTAAPAGQDYELWLIDDSGVPRSLGLLRDPVTQLAAVLQAGQTLAVSLEPEGGSPGDAPTGPVLAAAPLDDA